MIIMVTVLGVIGFFLCLVLMEFTNLGVRGIRQYDPGFGLLDMRLSYDANTVYQVFDQISEAGRKAYKHYLCLDYCFIACFMIVMLALSFKSTTNPVYRNVLIVLVVVRALFDLIENTLLMVLINNYPQQNIFMATVCSWSTTMKFVFLFLWVGMLLFVWGLNLIN